METPCTCESSNCSCISEWSRYLAKYLKIDQQLEQIQSLNQGKPINMSINGEWWMLHVEFLRLEEKIDRMMYNHSEGICEYPK